MNQNSIKALILDMDGVLWRGSASIGDLPAIFKTIQDKGWRTGFVTNNATRTIEFYTDKLEQFGIRVDKSQVLTSAQATGYYLSKRFPGGGRIFIVGEAGLFDILREHGFTHADDRPLAVVVALDRELTYEKIRRATNHVRAGALFIGTNRDPTLPTQDGIIPGAGSILAAIEVASGCKPIIIGKPNPEIFRLALARFGTAPEHTLVVGDRLDTDIAGGIASGCQTALVLSGDIEQKDLEVSDLKPDYIAEDLTALLNLLT
jgi:4-nitrophenyl phosphatase